MNPLPGFATFGTAGFTADTSSFSFKGAYVKGLANRHFAGIPNRKSIAALHESTHLESAKAVEMRRLVAAESAKRAIQTRTGVVEEERPDSSPRPPTT